MLHPAFKWKVTNGLLASQSTFCPPGCITWLPLEHAVHALTPRCGATGVTFNPLTLLWNCGGKFSLSSFGSKSPTPLKCVPFTFEKARFLFAFCNFGCRTVGIKPHRLALKDVSQIWRPVQKLVCVCVFQSVSSVSPEEAIVQFSGLFRSF